MKEIKIYNLSGEVTGSESLDESAWGKLRQDILHRYVVTYLANQRQGTVSTKTRGEVSGSGRKPWKQKGTGRARVGEIRNPVWRKGGVVFGPKPRDFSLGLPKKIKRKALAYALRDKIIEGKISLLEINPEEITVPKTKILGDFIKKLNWNGKMLFILKAENENIKKSLRNLKDISYCTLSNLNAYVILNNNRVAILKELLPDFKNLLETN